MGHSLETAAPFSLDPRTKTILCEQEENDAREGYSKTTMRKDIILCVDDPRGTPKTGQ
jgi:hypothetical protein